MTSSTRCPWNIPGHCTGLADQKHIVVANVFNLSMYPAEACTLLLLSFYKLGVKSRMAILGLPLNICFAQFKSILT